MINIAIFASGNGTNAENIIRYFSNSDKIKVVVVVANKADAFVLERAKKLSTPRFSFTKKELDSKEFLKRLAEFKVDKIVLAGFLLKVPEYLLKAFSNGVINIHPALLPKYGGKGMYGHFVHEAVLANKETESGITVHYVNENFDEGKHIFQARCAVKENETPNSLAAKIHQLEQENFPKIIEQLWA